MKRIRLPSALTQDWPPQLSGTDERGWFRFQRLYDIARSVLRDEADRILAGELRQRAADALKDCQGTRTEGADLLHT